jgi:hypothetical protein
LAINKGGITELLFCVISLKIGGEKGPTVLEIPLAGGYSVVALGEIIRRTTMTWEVNMNRRQMLAITAAALSGMTVGKTAFGCRRKRRCAPCGYSNLGLSIASNTNKTRPKLVSKIPIPPPLPDSIADSGVQIQFYVRAVTCHQTDDNPEISVSPTGDNPTDEIYVATTVGSIITRSEPDVDIHRNETLRDLYQRTFPMGEGEGSFLLHLRETDTKVLGIGADDNLGDAAILLTNRGGKVSARILESASAAVKWKADNELRFSGADGIYTVVVEIVANGAEKIPLTKG